MKEINVTKVELNLKKEIERNFLFKRLTVDSNDRVIDDTEFNASGDPVHRITYRYSVNDNISERIEFDASDNLIERHLYHENEEGIVSSSTIEFGNGSKTIKNYAFTDLGKADKATLTDENGVILGYETYILDDLDRIISEFESNSNHEELFKINREFDNNDDIIKEIQFSNGEIDLVTSNSYQDSEIIKIQRGKDLENFYESEVRELDSKKRLLKRTTTDHEYGDIQIEQLEYDSNDNMVSNIVAHNGRTIFTNLCKYDGSNRLMEEYVMELNLSGNINKHEQLYHKHDD
jgi:hypothetical protein